MSGYSVTINYFPDMKNKYSRYEDVLLKLAHADAQLYPGTVLGRNPTEILSRFNKKKHCNCPRLGGTAAACK